MTIEVRKNNIDLIKNALDSQIEKALYIMGEVIARGWKVRIQVDTGRARNSIDYTISGDTLIVGSPVEYVPILETRKASLAPTINAEQVNLESILKQVLSE